MRGRASLVVQGLRIQAAMPGTRVQSWSGKIPHATEQLSPWATTTKPALRGLGLQLEKPLQQEARIAQLDSSLGSNEDQADPEINKNKYKL